MQTLGKGRKQRITPLTKHTTDVLRAWARERAGSPDDPLFPSSRGRALSRDAVALIVTRNTETAGHACPTLQAKTASPHVYADPVVMPTLARNPAHVGMLGSLMSA
ncbi:MAG: hypothetical protein QOJ35_1646 [Solirubrobacteraceae bacterium]|nr:hypothetical protein [Solirubrobacteraceae bacterium]